MRVHIYIYMMQGSPPPPTPWYPPLPVKWVVVLFGLVAFPVPRLVLFGLVPSPPPPPPWSGACGLFGPPVGGQCVYRRMVWLLPLAAMSSLHALSPPAPPVVGACGRFGWPRPACVGQCVLQRYVWYGCCRLLAVMSSIRARYRIKI